MKKNNTLKIIEFLQNKDSATSNINQIAKILKISVGSAHAILTKCEKEGMVEALQIGNSKIYKLNKNNNKTLNLIQKIKSSGIIKKKTKIVCTIGPSCKSKKILIKLRNAGMDIIRINAAHSNLIEIQQLIDLITSSIPNLPIMIDVPGIKIRTTKLDKEILVKVGDHVKFSSIKEKGIGVNINNFHKRVKKNQIFTMDDNKIGFKIIDIKDSCVVCQTYNEGYIKSNKGLNIPDVDLGKNVLSNFDKQVIKLAIKNNISFVGISFVQNPKHLDEVNNLIKNSITKPIAKIETQQAMANYKTIIKKAYGIMIDRGDLGAEVGLTQIPRLQKKIIEECNIHGKPNIVATQMLSSMTESPYPTKSEISDIANAVLDGASAIMLSEETAIGKYPTNCVKLMSSIIKDIENEIPQRSIEETVEEENVTDVLGAAAAIMTKKLKINKILVLTYGGYNARIIARRKLNVPVIALTNNKHTYLRLNIMWGVQPTLIDTPINKVESVKQKKELLAECLKKNVIDIDDTILFLASISPKHKKITNMIEVHNVREFLEYYTKKE